MTEDITFFRKFPTGCEKKTFQGQRHPMKDNYFWRTDSSILNIANKTLLKQTTACDNKNQYIYVHTYALGSYPTAILRVHHPVIILEGVHDQKNRPNPPDCSINVNSGNELGRQVSVQGQLNLYHQAGKQKSSHLNCSTSNNWILSFHLTKCLKEIDLFCIA